MRIIEQQDDYYYESSVIENKNYYSIMLKKFVFQNAIFKYPNQNIY